MKLKLFFVMVLSALLLASCTAEADTAPQEETVSSDAGSAVTAETTDIYRVTAADGEETEINLDEITETTVSISAAGTYRIRGAYEGMILVEAAKTDEVTLILDGADITSPTSAAIYVKKAAKVQVTLADGSTNTLANGGEYVGIDANNIDAVIFSKSDLLLDGTGSLTVAAADAGHGIVSKDTLEIYGGTYDITSASHGISAKDSLAIADGTFTVTSGKDGIHAENNDDLTLGSVYIKNGTFAITSTGDGISASGSLQIDDINALIISGGGAENAEPHTDDMMMGGGRGLFGWDWDNNSSETTGETTDETTVTSFKALKSAGDMLLNGGMFTLDSAEDTIHTDANLTVNNGTYHISAGDDAVHADLALVINGGLLQVLESYEGIEAKTIDINDGQLMIKASDDGFNASGGTATGWNVMAAEEGVYFKVSGGTIYLDADGDGLDSNGDFIVTGGEVYVAGPTNSANGALDYGSEAIAQGGTVIAVGASGMAESFGENSTQGAIMLNTGNQQAGSTVTLADANGTVLAEYTFDKSFSNVVVTCPEIVDGGTYTLTAGTFSETVTMDGLLYGEGMGLGGMFGGFGGGRGNGGGRKDRGEREQTQVTEKEESPEVPNDVPELPEGEVPAMPEGEMPAMPEEFDPGAMGEMGGERPEMPEGEMPEIPQGGGRPEGGPGGTGELPQIP